MKKPMPKGKAGKASMKDGMKNRSPSSTDKSEMMPKKGKKK